MSNYLVSIISPSYNCKDFISQTIESVLAQSYSNWELLIVDDCSTDGTYEVANDYSAKDCRIRVLRNEKNCGAAVSRNKGIQNSKGQYVAFLDSDDIWSFNKLEKQLDFMIKKDIGFSYCIYNLIDDSNHYLGKQIFGPSCVTKKMLFRTNYLGCLTVMYKKSIIQNLSIPENIYKRNDHALWLKIIKKSDCYLLDECLASYRVGRKNSISHVSKFKMLKHYYRLYRISEGLSIFNSLFHVFENLCFGILRKMKYTRKEI